MLISIILPMGIFTGGVWQIVGQSSFFGIFILAILVCFSLFSWGIMFNKWRTFKKVEQENDFFLNLFRNSEKLADLTNKAKTLQYTPFATIFLQGYNEVGEIVSLKETNGAVQGNPKAFTNDDVETVGMALERATAEGISVLERRVVFLATTANSSPFLGLLGTVVGVMDAFWSIGERGSASLAVVAPGIAEALLATIVGLGAAIPAVIGYNWANNRLKYFYDRASNFCLEFQARIKKDMTL